MTELHRYFCRNAEQIYFYIYPVKKLDRKVVKSLFKPRISSAHKGDHGHALLIAGNKGKMGAAVISSRACLRTGAGLLTVSVPDDERFILQTSIPEAMIMSRQEKIKSTAFSSIGIGPGLGTSAKAVQLVKDILQIREQPVVWDADALNILSSQKNLLNKLGKRAILTPHPKEFDRLFGLHQTPEQRVKKTIEMAAVLDCVIVLKGSETVISCKQGTVINTTGNSGLAKGGSGDALTGVVTAFLAQGYEAFAAAQLGVYLHGLAADITLKTQSQESMLISDVIENIGAAFKHITE